MFLYIEKVLLSPSAPGYKTHLQPDVNCPKNQTVRNKDGEFGYIIDSSDKYIAIMPTERLTGLFAKEGEIIWVAGWQRPLGHPHLLGTGKANGIMRFRKRTVIEYFCDGKPRHFVAYLLYSKIQVLKLGSDHLDEENILSLCIDHSNRIEDPPTKSITL